jgi:hypothetical protein
MDSLLMLVILEQFSDDHCSRVTLQSKALHRSARGVTTDTLVRFQAVSHDCESHKVVHNWPSVVRVWPV